MPERIVLIIVITRVDVTRGSYRDEFVTEWGFEASDKHEQHWLGKNRAMLLVLHGCNEYFDSIKEIFSTRKKLFEAIGITESSDMEICAVYLFTHGIKDDLIDVFNKNIPIQLTADSLFSKKYSSRGNKACIGLFEELIKFNELHAYINEIQDLLTNDLMFDHWLLIIKKGLLRIYNNIVSITFDHKIQEATNDSIYIARELVKISKMEVIRYADKRETLPSTGKQLSPYVKACRMLCKALRPQVRGLEAPYDLQPEEFWEKFSQEASFNPEYLKGHTEELRHSFRLVSQEIDIMRTGPNSKPPVGMT